MTTLLQLVHAVTDELGISRPAVVASSTDPQIRQLFALLNRLGTDLTRQYEWQELNKEHILQTVSSDMTGTLVAGSNVITGIASTAGLSAQYQVVADGLTPFSQIVTVDSATQVTLNMPALTSETVSIQFSQIEYDLPSDWKKQIPNTEWDRTNRWPLMGPESPQDWQSFKSGIVYVAGPRERFRIYQNSITVNPPPGNGLVFAFEYISNAWVTSAAGVAQSKYLADTDVAMYEDSLLITGLKALWKSAKGLDGTFDLSEFRNILELNKSQNKSAPILSMSPLYRSILLTENNVQDANFPG